MQIGGAQLRDMIIAGAALLEKNKASIDALNVFPVPDGDTGTNMSMTMQSAVREVKEETGLDVDGLQYCGVVHWANTVNDDRYLCFMYRTSRFRGELIGETDEGRQFWIKREALFSAHESQFSCVHFALFHQPGRFREVMITNQEDEMICDYRLR